MKLRRPFMILGYVLVILVQAYCIQKLNGGLFNHYVIGIAIGMLVASIIEYLVWEDIL